MVEKTCMNCGTIGCDHKDARRCANGHFLWTPKLSEVEQLRQRVQELEKEQVAWRKFTERANNTVSAAEAKRDELLATIESHAPHGRNFTNEQVVKLTAERDELLKAAGAVVDRWDSPLWKNLPHTGEYIHRLREAIASVKEKQNAAD